MSSKSAGNFHTAAHISALLSDAVEENGTVLEISLDCLAWKGIPYNILTFLNFSI